MYEHLSYEGFWFLPERQEVKVPGVLRFTDAGRPYLKLLGWFYKEDEPISRMPDIILGETEFEGYEITLVDCFLIRGPIGRGAQVRGAKYGAIEAYIGKHYPNRDNIKTNVLYVDFSKPWLWEYPHPILKYKLSEQLPDDRRRTKKIHLNRNRRICDNPELKITYTEQFGVESLTGKTRYHITPILRFDTPQQKPLEDFRFLINGLRAFFSLGCRVPIDLAEWSFQGGSQKRTSPRVTIIGTFARGQAIDPVADLEELERSTQSRDKLFGVKEIVDSHRNALDKWMSNLASFYPIYMLFLEGIEERNTTIDVNVLSLAQAVEAFDQAVSGGASKKKILKTRIQDTTKNCIGSVLNYIGDVKGFSENVRDIRNYYSHYDLKSGIYPFSSGKLLDIHKKLRMVMEVNLLQWAGFSAPDVEKYFGRVWEYSDLT